MTPLTFISSQSVEFTGEELYLLRSDLSSYLDYLRDHNLHANYERTSRLYKKLCQYIDVL